MQFKNAVSYLIDSKIMLQKPRTEKEGDREALSTKVAPSLCPWQPCKVREEGFKEEAAIRKGEVLRRDWLLKQQMNPMPETPPALWRVREPQGKSGRRRLLQLPGQKDCSKAATQALLKLGGATDLVSFCRPQKVLVLCWIWIFAVPHPSARQDSL